MAEAWFHRHLACPHCRRELEWSALPLACICGFTVTAESPRDFRPQRPVVRTLQFSLGSQAQEDLSLVQVDRPAVTYSGPRPIRDSSELFRAARPPVTYSGPRPIRDSSELFSAAEPWLRDGNRLLDLGCGPRDQAAPTEHYGLAYAGVDFSSPDADLLAGAGAR